MDRSALKLTAGDKILLLLLSYTKYRGELQVPVDLTQDGIANNLGIIRSAVPRAVGSLMDKGHVEEYLAHVDKLSRRRKVYMLTDAGISAGRTMMDSLTTLQIEVIDRSGRKKEPLGALLSSGDVSLKNISDVVLTRKMDRTRASDESELRRKRTSHIHSLSPPGIFLDREMETSEVSQFIRSVKQRVMVIYGIAGVGKTTLSWKIIQMFGGEMNIFYIDLKEWTSLGYVLKELSEFLSRSGSDCLSPYLETSRDFEIEPACDLLKTLPQELPLLLIFDDLHRAPAEVNSFLTSLKERLPFMKGCRLIVLSRTRATFYDVRDVRVNGLVREMQLLGFDRETSRKFLIERGFGPAEVDMVIERTGGHPLALVLVEREGADLDVEDFDQFLKEEIFSGLTSEKLKLLGLLSLSRLQLGEAELSSLIDSRSESMRSLMDQHLVFGAPSGYMVHDLIKEQSVKSLDRDEKRECHAVLSRLFHEKLSGMGFHQDIGSDVPPFPFALEDETGLGPAPLFASEEVFHLIGADEPEEATEVLIKAVLQIPSKDLVREHAQSLVRSGKREKDATSKAKKEFLSLLLNLLEGNNQKALLSAQRTLKGASPDDPLLRSIKFACRLWLPYLKEKTLGPAEGLAAMEDLDLTGVPERLRYYILVSRASLMYKVGDHKGASGAYKEFLEAITGNEDLPAQMRDSLKDVIEKARNGSIQEATDQFQRIMTLTSANKDILREEMPFVDIDHHLLSAIYSLHYMKKG